MLYTIIFLLAIFAIVSLAVDVGRVRTSKAQLSTAADGAAFAGASALPAGRGDVSSARAAAIAVAAANNCNGTAVAMQNSDVEFGLYRVNSRRYTPAGSAEPGGHVVQLEECNAVRCTPPRTAARGNPIGLTFARIIGRQNLDVVASATAFVRGGPRMGGIIGLEWVEMHGTSSTDSYSPEPYIPANRHENGTVMSNGPINMNGTTDIYGDARPGMDSTVNQVGNATVHGWMAPLDEPLVFPPATVPSGTANSGQLRLNGNETRTLTPGTYWFTSVRISGNATLIIQPNVQMYVTGDIDMTGGSTNNPGPATAFEIFKVGNGQVDLGGGSLLKAHVYAPEAAVRVHGTGGFGLQGWVVGRTLRIDGNSVISYDETMPDDSGPFRTVLIK
jgi:hypothetical protein